MHKAVLIFLLAELFSQNSLSQPIVTINPATNFFIANGTTVSMDSLVLIPSAGFNIIGANMLTRNAAANHTTTNPYIFRVYSWTNSTPAFSGAIGLYYLTGELNGLNPSKLTLNIFSGILWSAYAVGVSRSPNYVWTPGIGPVPLNEITLADKTAPLVLPLRWGPIYASRKENLARIEWDTYNEVNVSHFEIERSANALQWQTVSNNIKANNNQQDGVYAYVDYSVPVNKTFYRIKEVDINGSYNYSPVSFIGLLPETNGIFIYPNPAVDQVWIRTVDPRKIINSLELYTEEGKIILKEIVRSNSYRINISKLAKGNYIMKASSNDNFFIQHIIKQ